LHQLYKEKISKALARKHAVKTGVKLNHDELRLIVEQLMECTKANTHFDGKPTYLEISKDYLSALFGI
jgi:DNA mismatch repair ATPase MutL